MTATGMRMRGLQRRAVLAMAVSAMALAGTANARSIGELVDLTVVDRDTGQALQVWRRDGRLFVPGRPGARYGLRVTNNSDARVLVVMSVDGVNILTGQTADYGQSGYVFGPRESYDVTGWRKSDTEVAAFTFAPLSGSYAARTGRPADVGVIGIAVFRERVVAPAVSAPEPRERRRGSADAAESEVVVTAQRVPSLSSPAPPPAAGRLAPSPAAPAQEMAAKSRTEKLGTGHGAREWSVVTTVPFERATRSPMLVRRIEYDSYDRLVAAGVIPAPRTEYRRPRPFPGAGYVPDPPGGC